MFEIVAPAKFLKLSLINLMGHWWGKSRTGLLMTKATCGIGKSDERVQYTSATGTGQRIVEH